MHKYEWQRLDELPQHTRTPLMFHLSSATHTGNLHEPAPLQRTTTERSEEKKPCANIEKLPASRIEQQHIQTKNYTENALSPSNISKT